MRKLALLAAATLATTSIPALAQTVNYNGTAYTTTPGNNTIVIDYIGVNTPDATGTLTLVFTGTSGLDYNFDWTLENTSGVSQGTGANISSFGFDILGGTVDASTSFASTNPPNDGSDTAIDLAVSGQNISGGNNKLDICFTAGATCSGGSNNGPRAPGETWAGDLGIEFTSALPSSITLANPIIRFQNTVPTGSDIGTPGGTPPVPEPATWAMMLMGFGATGVALRRSRRRKVLLEQIA